MKRKFFSVLTLTLFACTLSFSFANAAEKIMVPAQVTHKRIMFVENAYVMPEDIMVENYEVFKINTLENAIADLRSGKAGAIIYDYNVLKYVAASNPDLEVLPDTYLNKGLVFAINPSQPELKRVVDAKIDEMQSNGQLDGMRSYWFSETGMTSKMPEIIITPRTEGGNSLTYGTTAMNEPFAFIGNDTKPIGYEIELVMYVAQSLQTQMFVETMLPQQLLAAVESGKVDLAGGFMADSPRLQNVLVSKPYFGSGLGMMVLKK